MKSDAPKVNVAALFVYSLTFMFIVCKIAGWGVVASWSWWVVFSPILVYVGFILGVAAIIAIAMGIIALVRAIKR